MKSKRLFSFFLTLVMILSVIGITPVVEKVSAESALTSGATWVLIPDDLVTLDEPGSITISAGKDAVYKAFDESGRFLGIGIDGIYNGGNFYITGITKYNSGDTSISSITIPESVDLCSKLIINKGTADEDEEASTQERVVNFCGFSKTITISNAYSNATAEVSGGKTTVVGLGSPNSSSTGSVIREGSQNLTVDSLVLPSTVSSLGKGALSQNTRIKVIDMSKITTSDLTELGAELFKGDTNLEQVILPNTVTEIGDSAFADCKNLKSFDFSKINTIGDSAFQNCTSIENISLNSNSPLRSIGKNTFNGCTKLTELDFRNTNLNNIGADAFTGCSYLRKVYLPDVEVTMTSTSFSLGSVDYIYIASRNDKYKTTSGFKDYIDKLVTYDDVQSGPVVIKQGTTTTKGNSLQSITNTSTLYIASGVDVDIESVKVYRDGTDITSSAELSISGVTAKVNGRNVKVAAFTVPMYSYGNYTVTSKDVLGNSSTRQFAYLTTQSDISAPTVNVNGLSYTNGTTKRIIGDSATLVVSDDNSLSSVYVNDVNILGQENGYTLNGKGTYKIVARDMNNNTTTVTITLIGEDTFPPVVSGVKDGAYYNKAVSFTFSDDSDCKVSGSSNINVSGNKVTVSKDGTYKITITDAYKNATVVNFTIDTEAPTTSVQDGTLTNKDVTVTAKDKNLAKITLNGTEITSKYKVQGEGTYTVVVTDLAGNSVKASFTIDKTAPVIKGITEGKVYKAVKVNVSDAGGVESIKLDNSPVSNGTVVKKTGKHTLTVTDKAGNVAKISFKTDTKKPKITIKKSSYKVKSSFKVSDSVGIKTVKVGKKTYKGKGKTAMTIKFNKAGKIKITVTDLAGNKATKTVKVKKK